MKKYVPYIRRCLPGAQGEAAIAEAKSRLQELLRENAGEPMAVRFHTRGTIYPAIAVFDTLTRHGVSREDAVGVCCAYFADHARPAARKIRAMARVPGVYRLIIPIFALMTKKAFGPASGFEQKWYDTPKNELRADILACPYYNTCARYGCPELTRAFCESDDVCYGDMHPKLVWGRTKTIGKGGDCCDFRITRLP